MMMITLDDRRRVLELEVDGAYDVARIEELVAAVARLAALGAPWGVLERHHGRPDNLMKAMGAFTRASATAFGATDPTQNLVRFALVADDPHWLHRLIAGLFNGGARRARVFRRHELDEARAFVADFSGA